jgi:hypothetical protein
VLRAEQAARRRTRGVDLEQAQDGDCALLAHDLHEVFAPVVGVSGGGDVFKVLQVEEDNDQHWHEQKPRAERADPDPVRHYLGRLQRLLYQMSARIVAVEDPCSEQDTDDPAVRVTCLLRLAQVDAAIEVAEDAGCGVEVHA